MVAGAADTTTSTLIVETQLSVIKSTVTFQPLTVHKVIIWIELVNNYISCKFALAMRPLSYPILHNKEFPLVFETQLSVIKSTVTFQPLTVHKVIIWIELVSNYISSYPIQLKANLH